MNKAVWIIVVIVIVVAAGYFLMNRGYSSSQPLSQPSPTKTIKSSSPSAAQPTTTLAMAVSIKNFAFNPGTVTVKKGTTVTWTNDDGAPHKIVSDPSGAMFQSENLSQGQNYSFTFNTAGSFPYHCGIHPNMKGTVTVTE